ncbi:MAG: hypothetical protein U0168_28230 [Nannocystaceae bacterium]
MLASVPWLLWSLTRAQPTSSGVELQWHAPPPGPDRAAVLARIDALAGDDAHAGIDPPQLHARVRAQTGGFVLALEVRTRSGQRTRTLTAAGCDALADAVATEAALLLDAAAQDAITTPERDGSAATAVALRGTVAITAARLVPRRPARPHARVRAGLLAGSGVISRRARAHRRRGGAVAARRRRSIRVVARRFAPANARTAARGCRPSRCSPAVVRCGRRRPRGRVDVRGFELGARIAQGVGSPRRAVVAPQVAPALSPGIELALGTRVRLSLGPWLRSALVRPGLRSTASAARAGPRRGLGGAVRLELVPSRRRATVGRIRRARAMAPQRTP